MEKICLPLSIIRNVKLSPRAKIIWGELTLLPRDEKDQFAVNTKAVAQILHCCPGTLRRAIKILLEQKLIEYIETNKARERIYKFTTGMDTPKKVEPLKIETPSEVIAAPPVVEATPDILTPEKDEHGNDKLLCISWNPGRALNMGDKDFLNWAECVNKEFVPDFRQQFPTLNGTNSKPRIDLSMIQYLVMTNTHLGMVGVCSHIKKTLWEYAHNEFVPQPDMHVEWR